jgi:SAM-dependent methyltransferase
MLPRTPDRIQMKETAKSFEMRKERGDFEKYLKGKVIDIGSGDDQLQLLDPEGSVYGYDRAWGNGDAMLMADIADNSYDCVYSSHCLEDMPDVKIALTNWVRILKPGGILYIVVPDFTLYEKCSFPPSRFNTGHQNTFSLFFDRMQVGRDSHYGYDEMSEIIRGLGVNMIRTQVELDGYDFTMRPEIDQTMGNALAQICYIAQKRQ